MRSASALRYPRHRPPHAAQRRAVRPRLKSRNTPSTRQPDLLGDSCRPVREKVRCGRLFVLYLEPGDGVFSGAGACEDPSPRPGLAGRAGGFLRPGRDPFRPAVGSGRHDRRRGGNLPGADRTVCGCPPPPCRSFPKNPPEAARTLPGRWKGWAAYGRMACGLIQKKSGELLSAPAPAERSEGRRSGRYFR